MIGHYKPSRGKWMRFISNNDIDPHRRESLLQEIIHRRTRSLPAPVGSYKRMLETTIASKSASTSKSTSKSTSATSSKNGSGQISPIWKPNRDSTPSSPTLSNVMPYIDALFGPHVTAKMTSTSGAYSMTAIVSSPSMPLARVRERLGDTFEKSGVAPKRVLVKITDTHSGEHEAAIMRHLHGVPRKNVVCKGKTLSLDPAKYTPELYASGTYQGRYVLVMEFVVGRTLRNLAENVGHIPPAIGASLEKAVMSLWIAGVVHADLHRDNIMITRQNTVVILDFGTAVLLDPKRTALMTERICDPEAAFENPDIVDYTTLHQIAANRVMMNPNINALRDAYESMHHSPATSVSHHSPATSVRSPVSPFVSPFSHTHSRFHSPFAQ